MYKKSNKIEMQMYNDINNIDIQRQQLKGIGD